RAAVGWNNAECTGVLIHDHHEVGALNGLELVNAERLRSDHRHTVREESGIVRPANHAVFLSSRLQNRLLRISAARGSSTGGAIHAREIRLSVQARNLP